MDTDKIVDQIRLLERAQAQVQTQAQLAQVRQIHVQQIQAQLEQAQQIQAQLTLGAENRNSQLYEDIIATHQLELTSQTTAQPRTREASVPFPISQGGCVIRNSFVLKPSVNSFWKVFVYTHVAYNQHDELCLSWLKPFLYIPTPTGKGEVMTTNTLLLQASDLGVLPTCGRIEDKHFVWNGKEYDFPVLLAPVFDLERENASVHVCLPPQSYLYEILMAIERHNPDYEQLLEKYLQSQPIDLLGGVC